MAEAEDVIIDAARHATAGVQALWQRHRARSAAPQASPPRLADSLPRLHLLITAVFGTTYPIRPAQPPARATLLAAVFRHGRQRAGQRAVPATDGACIWLPDDGSTADAMLATTRWRNTALQQAMRAHRGSAQRLGRLVTPLTPLQRDVYLLLEAQAADDALAALLPGLAGPLNTLRQQALAGRPGLLTLRGAAQALESLAQTLLARTLLAHPGRGADGGTATPPSADASLLLACRLAGEWPPVSDASAPERAAPLFKDGWTGELRAPEVGASAAPGPAPTGDHSTAAPARSARLSRRPEARACSDDEDDAHQGAWMVQPAQPHEHAEDPLGLQRPTDRDEKTAAEDFAESLADLAQARLVPTPGTAREVLLSDDPPGALARQPTAALGITPDCASTVSYPEWDFRAQSYRHPGATVRFCPAPQGPQAWVAQTLATHRPLLAELRRRFALLRALRTRLHRQADGDEIDLDACIDGQADFRAGLPMAQALYLAQRRSRRDIAILLLIDISGSTDGWISAHRRVIDVEREALLLVCVALQAMGEPFAAQAFSGHGPQAVAVQTVKRFDEPYSGDVARRIAALAPDQYTRAGAAIRHASATLLQQSASHRLLLLLSDGKPNDMDQYDGRYGIEDTHQAVVEARLQGLFPFCLTVDHRADAYLPALFGARHYARLTQPALLPLVLLDWMKRLVRA